LLIFAFAILSGAKRVRQRSEIKNLLRRAPFRMPKTLLMDFFKKRKGLRQGGKEGLKTSARNPLLLIRLPPIKVRSI
jgi:hypothetical protein